MTSIRKRAFARQQNTIAPKPMRTRPKAVLVRMMVTTDRRSLSSKTKRRKVWKSTTMPSLRSSGGHHQQWQRRLKASPGEGMPVAAMGRGIATVSSARGGRRPCAKSGVESHRWPTPNVRFSSLSLFPLPFSMQKQKTTTQTAKNQTKPKQYK